MNEIAQQQETCRIYGVPWVEAPEGMKVGLARNVRTGLQPLNGLRHPPKGDTTGWYLWAGQELSQAPDFFEPVHVAHLAEISPEDLAVPRVAARLAISDGRRVRGRSGKTRLCSRSDRLGSSVLFAPERRSQPAPVRNRADHAVGGGVTIQAFTFARNPQVLRVVDGELAVRDDTSVAPRRGAFDRQPRDFCGPASHHHDRKVRRSRLLHDEADHHGVRDEPDPGPLDGVVRPLRIWMPGPPSCRSTNTLTRASISSNFRSTTRYVTLRLARE